MGIPHAMSFELRLRRDRSAFLLKLELFLVFAGGLAAVVLLEQSVWVRLVFTFLACLGVCLVLFDRLGRAGRRLRRAVVRSVKHRGGELFFFLPMVPSFSFNLSGFVVEAVTEDMKLVRFFDWRPWKIGQKLLVLHDIKGRVLAVRDIQRPVSLEVLRKLI